jgi:hypothetical protein
MTALSSESGSWLVSREDAKKAKWQMVRQPPTPHSIRDFTCRLDWQLKVTDQ